MRPEQRTHWSGEALVDVERGVFVPMHRRRIGPVFQEFKSFATPERGKQNLLFGRWFAPRRARQIDFDAVIGTLQSETCSPGAAPVVGHRRQVQSAGRFSHARNFFFLTSLWPRSTWSASSRFCSLIEQVHND